MGLTCRKIWVRPIRGRCGGESPLVSTAARRGSSHESSSVSAATPGDAVVVMHGVDHNHNGVYDFSAGKNDLDPRLPIEAANPTAGVVLHR